MAYQFAHIEFYSRKASNKKLSVHQILAEARRDKGACPHVENPRPPAIVYGMSLDDLESLHDRQADQATTTNNKGQTRKIRKDQQTMACVVLSYPSDGTDFNLWEDKSIQWMKDKYGDALRSVVLHRDEAHPHLHCYIMPDDMKASSLNEGKRAKDAFMQSPEATGLDSKEANKLGDRAYRSAMRLWQDSYWQAVGLPLGLSRIGPGKRRLSRDAWKAEQSQARHLKVTIQKGDEWGKRKRDEILKECQKIKDDQLRQHDAMKKELESISSRLQSEKKKLDELANQSLVKKLYNKFFRKGYEKGILENKQKYEKDISKLKIKISELSESVSSSDRLLENKQRTISKMESSLMESRMKMTRLQESNSRLQKQVEGLQEMLNVSKLDRDGFKV